MNRTYSGGQRRYLYDNNQYKCIYNFVNLINYRSSKAALRPASFKYVFSVDEEMDIYIYNFKSMINIDFFIKKQAMVIVSNSNVLKRQRVFIASPFFGSRRLRSDLDRYKKKYKMFIQKRIKLLYEEGRC